MSDGRPLVNNPARVPPPIEEAEPRQEGTPRTIHPIGSPPLPVGSEAARQEQRQRGVIGMAIRGNAYEIEEDSVHEFTDQRGRVQRVRLRKGTRIGLGRAAMLGLIEPAEGSGLARPTDEKPDVAPTEDQAAEADEEPTRRRRRGPAETTEAVGPAESE